MYISNKSQWYQSVNQYKEGINVKNFFIGIVTMSIFFIVNAILMPFIGQYIFIGDQFTISYHMFTYTGLMVLCGVIVVCTCIVVEKLNEVKDSINKSKQLSNTDEISHS